MKREDVSYYADEIRELLSLSAVRQEVYEGRRRCDSTQFKRQLR